jgi:aldehyde dehydrogenase (NAD+)
VLNLVPADRPASDHLIRNTGLDKVSFTGSTAAGPIIAAACGERMTRFTMELGGKSAAIVLDDFPIEAAGKMLARTITIMSGQVCAMLSRAIVPRHRHDALAAVIAAEMQQIRIGHSDDPATELGPLAMRRQLDRVEHYIGLGKSEGARLVTGGNRPPQMNQGYFIEPTLFADVTPDMQIAQDEIFGPVLCLMPCDDEADAIRIANHSIYGLNGSVLTHDNDAAWRVGRQVRAGSFGQNGMRLDFSVPYGGYKQSGIGREGGLAGMLSYTELKTLLLDGPPLHGG